MGIFQEVTSLKRRSAWLASVVLFLLSFPLSAMAQTGAQAERRSDDTGTVVADATGDSVIPIDPDYEWIQFEGFKGAYFYDHLAFSHLDQLRDAGFNAALVKFKRFNVEHVRLWAERAAEAKIRFFPVIDFAAAAELDEFKDIAIPTVLRDGTVVPGAPSPIHEEYWRRAVMDRVVALAHLANDVPIEGVLVDFELYVAESQGVFTYTDDADYSDFAVADFLKARNTPDLNIGQQETASWLGEHDLLEEYRLYLRERVQQIATEIKEAAADINPEMKFGLLPYIITDQGGELRATWFLEAVASGWGTPSRPVMVLSEHFYRRGYTADVPRHLAYLEQSGVDALFIPGIVLSAFHPSALASNSYRLAAASDGYWIFTTYSLAAPRESLTGAYRISYPAEDYWQVLSHLNAEITRRFEIGPSYVTDLDLTEHAPPIQIPPDYRPPSLAALPDDMVQGSAPPTGQVTRLRGSSKLYILVRPGEALQLHLQQIAVGKSDDPAGYAILGPDGELVLSGELGPGEAKQIVQPTPPGIYTLWIEAGRTAVAPEILNEHFVMEASQHQPLHIISRVRPLWFYVPEGTGTFALHLKASSRETARLVVVDPNNATVVDRVITDDQFIALDGTGRSGVWQLQLLRAPVGIFEDVEQIYLVGVPPYLSDGKSRVLRPSN